MHTVIRRYEGILETAEVARRSVDDFAPRLRESPGFQGYWVVDAGGGVLATISALDTEDEAADSVVAAAAWVQESVARLIPNPPEVTVGVTTGVMAEAPA